ncbi:MAG: hypothetical protein KF766_13890 [Rhodocyclaceae bacterium]|nr:hypothetical protein [Rhodocyclaceae bacterium]
MSHLERNYEEWKEIRSRIDSIANAVFLISGGALTLSISVLINSKAQGLITEQAADRAAVAWYWLLSSVLIFLFLKGKLILQSYLLQFHTSFVDKHIYKLNYAGWAIGVAGFISFSVGFIELVSVAVLVISN